MHPGGPFFFSNKERAVGSPLGAQLFELAGVANVLIAENLVTICKESMASWLGLKSSITKHGSKISIVEILEGKLYISMSSGYQGCASSQVTLRQGFEVMLKRVAPEIEEIVDTTNHAAGKKPYYPRNETGVN